MFGQYGKDQTNSHSSGLLPVFARAAKSIIRWTNFANHTRIFSHDAINRYLAGEKVTPHLIWENVKGQVDANY